MTEQLLREPRTWRNQFGDDYAIPAEVLAAVDEGILEDMSWGNDACPSFMGGPEDEDGGFPIRLWVEHPEIEKRELEGCKRFMVCLDTSEMFEMETDDVNEALAKVRELLKELDEEDPLPNGCLECSRSFGPHYTGGCNH